MNLFVPVQGLKYSFPASHRTKQYIELLTQCHHRREQHTHESGKQDHSANRHFVLHDLAGSKPDD